MIEVSFIALDEKEGFLAEIAAQSNHLQSGDMFMVNPISIDSYRNAGFYYKCKAVDPSRPKNHVCSGNSDIFNVTCKSSNYRYLILY